MKLAEYDDETLIEELKHRGIQITVKAKVSRQKEEPMASGALLCAISRSYQVIIGGVVFDL